MRENNNEIANKKWDFSDYAFTITGIIIGVLLVLPELMEALFEISIFGGSISNIVSDIAEGLDEGFFGIGLSFNEFRLFSPMLFLLTTTICFFQEAVVARKNGGYKGSMFTHTFDSLLYDGIYMAITTVMVYGAIFFGAMYASWLAAPISWILFVFIFPLVKKKSSTDKVNIPWLLLMIFAVGITAEIITRAWIAFPLSWLIICGIKLKEIIREGIHTIDDVFEAIYYALSVIYMTVGIFFNFWMISWTAFLIALFVCWILTKFGKFKKSKL